MGSEHGTWVNKTKNEYYFRVKNSTCDLGPIKHRENVVFEKKLFRIILQHIHYVD